MKKFFRTCGNVYFRLIAAFALLTVLVVGLAGGVSYSAFRQIYTDEIVRSLERSIQYESEQLQNDVFARTNLLMYDVAFSESYAEVLGAIAQTDWPDSVTISRAYNSISSLNNLYSSMISSIIVYYPQMNMLVSSNMGYKQLSEPYNMHYRSFTHALPVHSMGNMQFLVLDDQIALPGLEQGSLLLMSKAHWKDVSTSCDAVVIIALKNDYVVSRLRQVAAEGQVACLMDRHGRIICSSAEEGSAALAWNSQWNDVLLCENFVSMVSPEGAEGMLYMANPIAAQDWYFVYAEPLTAYAHASAAVMRMMLLAACAALLLGLLFALLFSRKLYSPLRELMHVVNGLPLQLDAGRDEYAMVLTAIDALRVRLSRAEQLVQVNRPIIRNMITHDLLCGMMQQEDGEHMQLSGIELPFAHYAVVMIEWCEQDASRLPTAERGTLHFALRDILEAQADENAKMYAYLPSRLRIVLLINAVRSEDEIVHRIVQCAQNHLSGIDVRCMAAFGGWTQSPVGLSESYRSARLNMEQRLFCDEQTAVTPMAKDVPGYSALEELEDRFAQHVRAGRTHEAVNCVSQLVELWCRLPPSAGMKSLHTLCATLKELLVRKKYHVNGELPLLVTDPKQVIWHISEYPQALRSVLERALGAEEYDGALRNEVLFSRTVDYVNQNLAEDLSLERISAQMHFNPKYFGRLFKEIAGVNWSEYITARRIERAAELLRSGAMSVEEVAQCVGYGSVQYFTRRFKETYGVKPRDYRLCRAEEKRSEDDPVKENGEIETE